MSYQITTHHPVTPSVGQLWKVRTFEKGAELPTDITLKIKKITKGMVYFDASLVMQAGTIRQHDERLSMRNFLAVMQNGAEVWLPPPKSGRKSSPKSSCKSKPAKSKGNRCLRKSCTGCSS